MFKIMNDPLPFVFFFSNEEERLDLNPSEAVDTVGLIDDLYKS